MVWDTVLEYLQKNVQEKTAPIVLAVSGGIDSMVLMHFLFTSGYTKVHCCYFDHGLRDDTDQDWEIITRAAEKYGYTKQHINIAEDVLQRTKKGENLENAARILRYIFLEQARQEQKALWILTAHHKNDLLESQLMHFGRGAGLYGLIGIQEVDKKHARLRILLSCTKEDIITYAKQHQIVWHEDSTNEENTYLRNQLRHEIVPNLTHLYPSLTSSAQQLSQHVQEVLNFHTSLVVESLGDMETTNEISLKAYKKLPIILQKHALLLLIRSLSSSYTSGHIETLRETLCHSLSSGKILHITSACRLERSFDKIRILRDGEYHDVENNKGGLDEVPTLNAHSRSTSDGNCESDSDSIMEIELPFDMRERNLIKVFLTNKSRIRQYRFQKHEGNLKGNASSEPIIWHTTFKKWRMQHAISWQEARNMYGIQDVLTGDIVAVLHKTWHYPESLAKQYRKIEA